jgi:hypothetical protein
MTKRRSFVILPNGSMTKRPLFFIDITEFIRFLFAWHLSH